MASHKCVTPIEQRVSTCDIEFQNRKVVQLFDPQNCNS